MNITPNADLSNELPSITNTFGISGHASVTNIGRITYEGVMDDGTAAGTYEKVTSIDERLRVVHDDVATNKTLGWLAAPDPSANYVAARGKHQVGTGIWFNRRADFREWKYIPGTVLCIYGAPGSGKTILSSSIIEELKAVCESRPLLGCAYFFFDSRSAEKGLLLYNNLIRSLLAQLSSRCNGIPAALQDLYRNHGKGREQPSLKSLHETLRRVIEGFDHVYIVIDSLDECGDRSELLRWITSADIWGSPNLHLLVTSRQEPDIRQYLDAIERLQRVIIEGPLSEQDIETYLDARLAKIKRWSKETREAVKKMLMERADGMFRWVALQLDDLENCFNSRAIKKQLDALPKDLEETYERILARSPHRRDLLQLLHWLAFSARALSVKELAEIISIDFEAEGRPSFDAELRYDDPTTVLTVCAGLITETNGQVKLAHFSVKEYLISEHIKAGVAAYFNIGERSSHLIIAQTCLAYLLIFDKHEAMPKSTPDSFPLALYAATHWITHFRAARDSSHAGLLKLLLSLFDFELTSSYAMINWVRLNDPHDERIDPQPDLDRPVKGIPAPIYYASLLGLTQAVQCLLAKGNDPDGRGNIGTALNAASFGGHLDIIKLLLESGAEVNAHAGMPGRDYENMIGTSLVVAASGGYLEIVQLLLKSGADVDAQGKFHGTALQKAASGGHLKIVQLLLESGAEVDAQGGHDGTALAMASFRGQLEIAQLLLDSGAEVNAQGGAYRTALVAASSYGNLDIAQLLLDSGAEVNAQGGHYGTALQAASSGGNLDIAQLLLDSGAEINAQGGDNGTALVAAASSGNLDIAQLLLDSGAEINAQGENYDTALVAASYNGHLEIAQWLLESGAEVNAQGEHYGTALVAASYGGHLEITQWLLDSGAEINAQGWHYGTALRAASFYGNLEIVQLLLESGAEVNTLGKDFDTALRDASSRGHFDIAKLLLESGAEVNAQTEENDTALIAAVSGGHLEIAQLLLQSGAEVNAQVGHLGTALWGAACLGHLEIAQLLLESGAEVSAQGMGWSTPLVAASYGGHLEITQLLLESGAEVNATRGGSDTALVSASFQGHLEIAQLLLESGAEVNAQGGKNGTALVAASSHGHLETAQLLLERGAEVNVPTGSHGTALEAARTFNSTPWGRSPDKRDLVLLLLAHGALEGGEYKEEQLVSEGDDRPAEACLELEGGSVESEEEEEYFEAEG